MLRIPSTRILIVLSLAAGTFLTGCSGSFDPTASNTTLSGASFKGSVHGGQSPVSGAFVYLFATSTSGYNTPNTSLLTLGAPGVTNDGTGAGYVTTNALGNFTITGDYSCPTPSSQIYIAAAGGNPGLPGNVNNPALVEIAALGTCSTLLANAATGFITINELTTVAAITALAPFANLTFSSLSTSATNVTGLTNAFVTAGNLVNVATGVANATTASTLGAIPVAELNTLADILATCVNSTGIGAPCSTLFAAATPPGGTAPTNTAQAMYNIATHPSQNVSTLFKMVTGTPPFVPTLTGSNSFAGTSDGTPSDWTIAIVYTDPRMPSPYYLAIDSKDNIWMNVSNRTAVQLSNAGVINYVVIPPIGESELSGNNYNQVLAIDLNDALWVDNNSYGVSVVNKIGKLVTAGVSGWGYEPGPGSNNNFNTDYVSGFGGIAIDGSGNALIGSANGANSGVVKASGTTGFGLANYTGGGLRGPTSVAVDPSGNIWLAGNGSNAVVEYSSTGTVLSGATGYPTQNGPIALAFDHAGDALVANYSSNTITALSNTGVALLTSPLYGGGLHGPSDLAVDGAGNLWLSNFGSTGISEFNLTTGNPITPITGYYSGAQSADLGSIAIDSAGSVWVSDWGGSSIRELVGAAAPTINPVAVAVKNNTIGTKP